MIKQKILLLEDDVLFSQSLCDFLDEYGFEVNVAYNIKDALLLSYSNNYDLYILDINLPDGCGVDLLKDLRLGEDNTPAIFLTSYKDKDTLYSGYKSGCDDFLNKPIDLDELYFKIIAIFKRIGKTKERIKINTNLEYDLLKKSLFCADEQIVLSQKTAILLDLLIQNRGKLVPKESIISTLWRGYDDYSDGSIRVYINQIKKIVGDDKIKNHKGLGYTFEN